MFTSSLPSRLVTSIDPHEQISREHGPNTAALCWRSKRSQHTSRSSHAAVCAREASIPCVSGCVGATDVLKTGELVRVDGNAGTVTRLDAK